jgi:hypothetical protein
MFIFVHAIHVYIEVDEVLLCIFHYKRLCVHSQNIINMSLLMIPGLPRFQAMGWH